MNARAAAPLATLLGAAWFGCACRGPTDAAATSVPVSAPPPEPRAAARVVTWKDLSSWPYEDGLVGMPASVKQLSGQRVELTGFFHVGATMLDGYCVDIYQLQVEHIDALR
jgi:hypothetical protein